MGSECAHIQDMGGYRQKKGGYFKALNSWGSRI